MYSLKPKTALQLITAENGHTLDSGTRSTRLGRGGATVCGACGLEPFPAVLLVKGSYRM